MSEKGKQIIATFEKVIPQMNEMDKGLLPAFVRGRRSRPSGSPAWVPAISRAAHKAPA